LLAAWVVDEVVEHWPERCGCGHVFCEADRVAVGEPARHQIEELPVMAVCVIEHRCQRVACPGCGRRRTGALLAGVAQSAFGPRLQAAIVTLAVRNRVSRRDTVELCEQLFASRISTGTVDAILQRAADALAEPCADLLERVRAAPAVNMDETGWRLRGGQRALWGAFTDRHAILSVEPTATRIVPRTCSPTRRRSSPAIAGGPTAICPSAVGRPVGRICSAILPSTPRAAAPTRSSASTDCASARRSSGPGRSSSTPATGPSSSAASAPCSAN